MHSPFFPLRSEAEILDRQFQLAQEFSIYDETMLSQRFFYLSDKVEVVRANKAKAVEEQKIYIGG